jgi:hypothetical protein
MMAGGAKNTAVPGSGTAVGYLFLAGEAAIRFLEVKVGGQAAVETAAGRGLSAEVRHRRAISQIDPIKRSGEE